jgi:hypothetical protein
MAEKNWVDPGLFPEAFTIALGAFVGLYEQEFASSWREATESELAEMARKKAAWREAKTEFLAERDAKELAAGRESGERALSGEELQEIHLRVVEKLKKEHFSDE